MNWIDSLNENSLPWLLEQDPDNPGPRFFALRDLLDLPKDAPDLVAARQQVMSSGPVPVILANQDGEGWWEQPGGYYPKYTGTVWSLTFLSQLGADGTDPRIQHGCKHVLENNIAPYGGISMDGKNSGLIHCLQGNLCAALLDLGWSKDERLLGALDWMARSVNGEGIAPAEEREVEVRYYRSGNSGPGFQCSANNHLPCAWGAIKVMLALSKVPEELRTPATKAAIETGIEFLFSRDPAQADYPMGYSDKPNRSWFKFGYPIAYVTDVLQNMEVLSSLGYARDSRLEHALDLLLSKRDDEGCWPLEYTYNGKTWVDVEIKAAPSKWVTLRALRVIKAAFN